MKIIRACVSETAMKILSKYGTKWYTNEGKVVAIEIKPNITINFMTLNVIEEIHPTEESEEVNK